MKRSLASLCILLSLLTPQPNTPPVVNAQQPAPQRPTARRFDDDSLTPAERRARAAESFKRGRELLARKSVPFDPDELLTPGWERRLAPTFAAMPEMQQTRRLGGRLRGVQLGDTLYLPERVELTGDTVVLARRVIFEGRHAVIKGNFSVAFLPAETDGVLGTTLEAAMLEQGVRFTRAAFDPAPRARTPAALKRFRPRLLQEDWSITIDTSGRGYKEWLEEQQQRARPGFRKTSLQGETIDKSGAPGSKGDTGDIGETGVPGAPDPARKGDDGVCGSSPDDPDGLSGAPGNNGGTGLTGGIGKVGKEGGNAGTIIAYIRSRTGTHTYLAYGGQGGEGGEGGQGGTGGPGATGGMGGFGVDCPCQLGAAGDGGTGGPGGRGGKGGTGGKGGPGGIGGMGNDITLHIPSNFGGLISYNLFGGRGGPGGGPGRGGLPGTSGSPGGAGRGATNHNCRSSSSRDGGAGQFLPSLGPGELGTELGESKQHIRAADGKFTPITIAAVGDTNCTTPGFNGSCPYGTYPDGYGMCCSGSCGVEAYAPGRDEPSPRVAAGGGGGGCSCDDAQRLQCYNSGGDWDDMSCSCVSPIVVDTEGDGFDLTDGAGGVEFDFTGAGTRRRMAWTAAGSDDAWLALDRDGNGTVDDGRELFGTSTPQPVPPPGGSRNGFRALEVYDRPGNGGNADGVIDARDAIFPSLRLWLDADHDGVSQPGELHALTQLGLKSIGLDYKESRRTDEHGNRFQFRAKVEAARGEKVGRWAWDVFPVRAR